MIGPQWYRTCDSFVLLIAWYYCHFPFGGCVVYPPHFSEERCLAKPGPATQPGGGRRAQQRQPQMAAALPGAPPLRPTPARACCEPLDFDSERWAQLLCHFIDCTEPAYRTIDTMRSRARSLPGFTVHEMATGHCPMVSQPEALVALLLSIAA